MRLRTFPYVSHCEIPPNQLSNLLPAHPFDYHPQIIEVDWLDQIPRVIQLGYQPAWTQSTPPSEPRWDIGTVFKLNVGLRSEFTVEVVRRISWNRGICYQMEYSPERLAIFNDCKDCTPKPEKTTDWLNEEDVKRFLENTSENARDHLRKRQAKDMQNRKVAQQ